MKFGSRHYLFGLVIPLSGKKFMKFGNSYYLFGLDRNIDSTKITFKLIPPSGARYACASFQRSPPVRSFQRVLLGRYLLSQNSEQASIIQPINNSTKPLKIKDNLSDPNQAILYNYREAIRPPVHIRPQLDIGYVYNGRFKTFLQIRPDWRVKTIIRQSPYAKIRHTKTKGKWTLN